MNFAPCHHTGRTLGHLLCLTLLAAAIPLGVTGESPTANEAAIVASASKHITESIPKGLTATKETEPKLRTRPDKSALVEFTLELECDEPRYTVRDLMSAGKPLPGEVGKQLQTDNLSSRYLARKYDKGDAIPTIHDSFSVRPDGSFGAIKSLTQEKLGYLRSEQADLPVEGDAKQQAAKVAADAQVEVLKKNKAEHDSATTASIFSSLKELGGTIGGMVGNKAKTNTATNVAGLFLQPPGTPAVAAAPPQAPQAAPAAPAPGAAAAPPSKGNDRPAAPASEKPGKTEAADKGEVEWLTPTEAASKLKITEADLMSAINNGEIKAKKIGTVWRIRAKDLE